MALRHGTPGTRCDCEQCTLAAGMRARATLAIRPPAVPAWATRAACLGVGRRAFFAATPAGRPTADQLPDPHHQARRVCAGCLVWDHCLYSALDAEAGDLPVVRFGIFGGLTGDERCHLEAHREAIGETA